MKKVEILSRVVESGVVAVIRADSKEEAINLSKACVQGGIHGIEITFTLQGADEVIKELADQYKDSNQVVIGAGSVLDVTTARIAIMAGAQFVVSPAFDEETAKLCNLYQVPFMPGCITITEMKHALEAGVDIVKLFPGSAFGPDFVKAVKAPLPQLNIMPTGGVDLNNIEEWIRNGCVAVGVGGNLIVPGKKGNYDQVTDNAIQYMDKVRAAKKSLQLV